MIIKRFFEWFLLKEKLHDRLLSPPPLVHERDLWWVIFGENIGVEVNGKNESFSRPAVILKKFSKDSYLVAPTTSKNKVGTWYAQICHKGIPMSVCLHQIRAVDYRRLSSRIGAVDENDFQKIKTVFGELYK